MDIGMIGLGRMGGGMARRLVRGDHRVVGYDLSREMVEEAESEGVVAADSLEDLVGKLPSPRVTWMMVPAGGPVDDTIEELLSVGLEEGDILVDGGNSNYKNTMRRADLCAAAGHHLVDVGTSGGIWGLREGYSMMVGGEEAVVERLRPIFETLAPAPDKGWGRTGETGSGHFVKMVHNGIEYGLMQAYAEGFAVMEARSEFELDLEEIAEMWMHGSVVRSWLLELTASAIRENPGMEGIAPYVPDSGEGRWTVKESIDLDVPAPVITLSLLQRIGSRDEFGFADRLLSALRNQFGGHDMEQEG